MKNPIVLAAALAAGLTTFAANAKEVASQAAATPGIGNWTRDAKEVPAEAVAQKKEAAAEKVVDAAKEARKVDAPAAKKPEERYRLIIARHALENGISIDLAHAVVTVESNYKPYSKGKAGEVGLMQIKPATAKLMGYKGSTTGLFDPETNIKYGMKYLGKAQKLGDGTTCGTILKYNAGHGAKRMNPISRNYCNKVKTHLAKSDTKARQVADSGA
jgi:soluble lytic murein transglycosylase-like protein